MLTTPSRSCLLPVAFLAVPADTPAEEGTAAAAGTAVEGIPAEGTVEGTAVDILAAACLAVDSLAAEDSLHQQIRIQKRKQAPLNNRGRQLTSHRQVCSNSPCGG